MVDPSSLPSFIKSGSDGLNDMRGPSVYVSIKDGESLQIAPVTELDGVISFQQHQIWLEAGNSPMLPCLQSKDCPGCAVGNNPKFRAVMIVQVQGEDNQKLLPMGKDLFRQIVEINDAIGTIKGQVIRISRRGAGINTKYTAMPTNKSAKVRPAELNAIEHIGPLDRAGAIDVLKQAGMWPPPGGSGVVEDDWADVSFDEDEA